MHFSTLHTTLITEEYSSDRKPYITILYSVMTNDEQLLQINANPHSKAGLLVFELVC